MTGQLSRKVVYPKEERLSLQTVHSQVLQNVLDRLDKAFESFFCRCKIGEKPGFPRFQGEHRKIPNPQFIKKGSKNLAKSQRKFSKLEKGTRERRKAGKVVAKIHERIKNQRNDFCHKQARKIVDQYHYIFIEDLNTKNMMERSPFAQSIAEASWNQFRQILTYKAEEAGRKLGLVNPAYTSQVCSE